MLSSNTLHLNFQLCLFHLNEIENNGIVLVAFVTVCGNGVGNVCQKSDQSNNAFT